MSTPWASIARIDIDGSLSGTGFLIGPKTLVTAHHVVAAQDGRPKGKIGLRFNPSGESNNNPSILETSACIISELCDAARDFAVLECAEAPLSSNALRPSSGCHQFDEFSSSGFALQDPNGFTCIGKVASLNDPAASGGPVIALQFNFTSGVKMKGHSGAPVLIGNRVVGMLRTAYLDAEDLTMGGMVQAVPIQYILERCHGYNPGLLSIHPKLSWPVQNSRIRPVLADRKPHFQAFEAMITGKSEQRVLLMEGPSGSGKSMMVEKFEEYARALGVSVVSADFKNSPPFDQVIGSFRESGGTDLFRSAGTAQRHEILRLFLEDFVLRDRPILLSLDNWQDVPDEFEKWLKFSVAPKLKDLPHVVVLITGHEVPAFSNVAWKELTVKHPLEPIESVQDWLDYCSLEWPTVPIAREHIFTVLKLTTPKVPKLVYENLLTIQRELIQENRAAGSGSAA